MDALPSRLDSPTQTLLKRLRAMGLSQSEIARRSNIPQPRLSRWEGGEVPAGADDAFRLQALEAELLRAATKQPRRRAVPEPETSGSEEGALSDAGPAAIVESATYTGPDRRKARA